MESSPCKMIKASRLRKNGIKNYHCKIKIQYLPGYTIPVKNKDRDKTNLINMDKGDTVWDKKWRFQNKKIKPLLESHG